MSEFNQKDRARVEQAVLPHVNAAFNLARWLVGKRKDAEEVTRDALLQACRDFQAFHQGDVRAWVLQTVRNTCYAWLEKNCPSEMAVEFKEELHQQNHSPAERLTISGDDRQRLTGALEALPPRLREVFVLRQLEGCSYKEIAAITSTQVGTVMSFLALARQQLCVVLSDPARKEADREV